MSAPDLDAIQAALVAALKASPRDNYGAEFIDDLPYVNLWETGVDAQRVSLCIDDTFDADKLATHLHASLIAPLEARIAELEAENSDLEEDLMTAESRILCGSRSVDQAIQELQEARRYDLRRDGDDQ